MQHYVEGDLEDKPLKELLRSFSQDSVMLVRQETELFKREMNERIAKIEKQVAVLGAGGVVAFIGALVLTAALVLALNHVMPDWVAALIVGAVYCIVGLVLVARGKNKLSNESIAPRDTIQSVKRDVHVMREAMR